MGRRLPAEWEEQDAVLLAWPHKETDWVGILDEAQQTFAEIINTIALYQRVLVVGPSLAAARRRCSHRNVSFHPVPTNDTWARDFGPITVLEDDRPLLLDYTFNGWGNKFSATLDNRVTRELHGQGVFGTTPLTSLAFILEGGSIESDGEGTILTTATCLQNPNRNGQLSRAEIECHLAEQLGGEKVLWLQHGWLAGDDTDAHIDTLARLGPDKTILHVACDDPDDEHFEELAMMAAELRRLTDFRLLPLPWPAARLELDGHRLPATYANYLVINGAVLVPTYGCGSDAEAMDCIARGFPGREVLGIDCSTLIRQHGSLHCVTMQLPRGVLGCR